MLITHAVKRTGSPSGMQSTQKSGRKAPSLLSAELRECSRAFRSFDNEIGWNECGIAATVRFDAPS